MRTIVFAKRHDDFQRLARTFSKVILSLHRGLAPNHKPLEVLEDLIPTKEKILEQHPESLFLALVKTSIVRPFRILYERDIRDREKRGLLAPDMRSSTAQGANPADGDTITGQCKSPQSSKSAPGEANQTAERDDEARSENQLTVLSIDVNRYNTEIAGIDSASPTSDEKSAPPISEAGMMSFPRAPKIPNGQKKGICPICKQEFPAEELQGDKWIVHATKDIKPYVCIHKDCMSDIQFFEHRRDWIDHMHKFHMPYWILCLYNTLRWKCSLCCSDSAEEFISEEEVKKSVMEHLEQLHPDTKTEKRQKLVNWCEVHQLRSLKHCPICGVRPKPRSILRTSQSKVTKGDTRAGPQVLEAGETKDGSNSEPKHTVRFADPESSHENCHSEPVTDYERAEHCVAEHLRALALHFSAFFMDDDDTDDQRHSDVPLDSSSDSD
ncbi:serine/threonine protein kinase [Trichoderma harzianum]|uniref:Serine/threonine protein kinase n=1 Tax=Trichoderma harzianum TaxID=5544 RepID=A0A0F9XQK3_TRIHA|nr:serine/threonine protein kinase [Trichoderma harzianum]